MYFLQSREQRGRGGRFYTFSQQRRQEALVDVNLNQWLKRAAGRARLQHFVFFSQRVGRKFVDLTGIFFLFLVNNATKPSKGTTAGLPSWSLQEDFLHCVVFFSHPGPEKSILPLKTAGLRPPRTDLRLKLSGECWCDKGEATCLLHIKKYKNKAKHETILTLRG